MGRYYLVNLYRKILTVQRKQPIIDQLLAKRNAVGKIDCQNVDGGSSNRRRAFQQWSIPREVFVPIVLNRMKQSNDLIDAASPFNPCDVWTFMIVARETNQRKIVERS